MSIRFLTLAVAAIATLQPQSTFRSGIDLIRLDVSVVDRSGRPVPNLRPEDFSIRIDGSPRPVAFAKFYGLDDAAPPPTFPLTTSFATNVSRAPGRVVVFVVDLESMNAGSERLVLETAGKLIDRLGPSDSTGFLAIPGKGVDLTRDHARVKARLTSLRGFASRSSQRHALSISEAEAFERGDRFVMAEAVERECRQGDMSCPREMRDEAKQLLVEAKRRIQDVLTTLTTLSARLQHIDAPKSVVLLSAGLPFPEDARSRFIDLQRSSAASGVTTYVVQIEQADADAGNRRPAGTSSLPRSDLALGLSTIAGVTDGEYFSGVGRAGGVFERIQTEINNSYQLGIEALPQDANGRTHKIDVQVKRSGLTVKSRKELVVSNVPRPTRTPADILDLPTGVVEAPIAVSAYSTRGEEPSTLKVILLVELLGGAVSEPLPAYAVSVINDGQAIFETADRTSASGPLGARAIIGAQIAPGQYRLRAAVIDSSGRPGSIEMPLGVGLRQAGPFQFSDLLLGTSSEGFAPASHLPSGTPITTYLELYATDPAQFDDVNIVLELRRVEDTAAIARGVATIARTAQERRCVAEGRLATEGMEPGLYSVSAIVSKGTMPIGKVSRTLSIKAL